MKQTFLHATFLDRIPESIDISAYRHNELLPSRSVFLSYSHKDKRFVRGLARSLVERDIRVWMDEGEILVGESLIGKLRDAIDEVDFVLAVISQSSVRSQWVQKELDIAMNQEIAGRWIKVLPILRDECDLPGFLCGKVWADFRKRHRRSKSIEILVHAINNLERSPPPYPGWP